MKKKAQHIAAKVKAPVKVSDKKIEAKPVTEKKNISNGRLLKL